MRIPSGLIKAVIGAEAAARHLGRAVPAIVYVDANDEDGTNVFTSEQATAILGYEAEGWRIDRDGWMSLVHEEDRPSVLEEYRRSRTEARAFGAAYRLRASDGSYRWFRDEAVPLAAEGGAPLCWRGVMLDVTGEAQAGQRLAQSEDALRRTLEERRTLLARLEESLEEERRRIASDLHDDPIQVISAADMQLQALGALADGDPEVRRGIDEVHETLKLAVDRLRQLLSELRPAPLGPEGLEATLRAFLEELRFPVRWSLEVRLNADPPADIGAVLFRIAQEAITNAGKHARAERLRVSVSSRDGGIELAVTDDGSGFDRQQSGTSAPGHIGLATMAERAELAGGWCTVKSSSGGGTSVRAWVPLPSAELR